MLDRDLALRQQAHELDEEAAGYYDRAVAVHLRLERRAQRQLHVRCGQMEPATLSTKENAGENLNAGSGRHCARNDSELLRELLATTDDFHPRSYHGVAFNHLKPRCSRRGCGSRGGGPCPRWLSHSRRGCRWWKE